MFKIVRYVLLAMLILYVYKHFLVRFFKRTSAHPQTSPQPILKAPCPDHDCDGEVRRINDKADVIIWQCSKCGKTYNKEAIILGSNKE